MNGVLGDILKTNYVVDPEVDGSVTARTARPVPKKDVLAILENILALNQASLIKTNGIWHVVPSAKSKTLSGSVVMPRNRQEARGLGVHIIPLSYTTVDSVIEVIQGQINPDRQLVGDARRNLLIFVGPRREANLIEEMVGVLDTDLLKGMSFGLLPIKVARLDDVRTELEVIFGQDAGTPTKSLVRFLPIERLNAILAISSQRKYIVKAEQWVRRLDRANSNAGRRAFVYFVRNGRATELAGILTDLFVSDGQSQTPQTGRPVAPGLEAVQLDRPESTDEQSEERRPETAPQTSAARLAPISADGEDDIRIIADERNNALVIRATADEYRSIETMLVQLDILPLQVLIEVTVAEVTLDGDLEYGLDWFFQSGKVNATLSNRASGAVGQQFPGFSLFYDSVNAAVVLNALAEVTNVKVISSPKLMVLDNQSARLQVGDQVPVATQSSVSTANPDAPIVNSVSLVDTGIILEVKPTVNEGGLVSLQVLQEVSDATVTQSSGIDSPTIQKRRVESRLAVQSGETIVLAGLIRDRKEIGESGIPVLKDVPVLGNLFKTTSERDDRTELIVLITPRVVRNPTEIRQLTNDIRRQLSTVDFINKTEAPFDRNRVACLGHLEHFQCDPSQRVSSFLLKGTAQSLVVFISICNTRKCMLMIHGSGCHLMVA